MGSHACRMWVVHVCVKGHFRLCALRHMRMQDAACGLLREPTTCPRRLEGRPGLRWAVREKGCAEEKGNWAGERERRKGSWAVGAGLGRAGGKKKGAGPLRFVG